MLSDVTSLPITTSSGDRVGDTAIVLLGELAASSPAGSHDLRAITDVAVSLRTTIWAVTRHHPKELVPVPRN